MTDREKVIKGLKICSEHGSWHGVDCRYNEAYKDCPYRGCETGCVVTIAKDALALLKAQEPVEPREQEETRTWTVCGNCFQHLISKWIWCPYCGRKVKWA